MSEDRLAVRVGRIVGVILFGTVAAGVVLGLIAAMVFLWEAVMH